MFYCKNDQRGISPKRMKTSKRSNSLPIVWTVKTTYKLYPFIVTYTNDGLHYRRLNALVAMLNKVDKQRVIPDSPAMAQKYNL